MEGPLDSRLCDPFGGDGFIDDTAPERVILRRVSVSEHEVCP